MHEGTVTSQIVENVLREAQKRNAKRVLEVQIEIGKLTFLNPEQVRFWYETLIKDTILNGSKLVIEEKEGVVRCPECGYKGGFDYVDDPAFHTLTPTLNCPKCGGIVEIVGGRDCFIKRVKMLI